MTHSSKKCPLVLVEWLDSRQPSGTWQRLADFEPAPVVQCVSVGFLVQDTDSQIALAPNMGDVGSVEYIQMSGVVYIPRSCITAIHNLTETTRRDVSRKPTAKKRTV
jgi:hypothetical protein